MTHHYAIDGMTCGGCVANVTNALRKVPGVKSANVNLTNKEAIIEMNRHIPEKELQEALGNGKYKIQETNGHAVLSHSPQPNNIEAAPDEKTDLQRLYPLFLIFAYLSGLVLLAEVAAGGWEGMRAMQHFMGGFFLVFSFFKLLDLRGFAASFSMYDPLAKKWLGYGFVYPFVELGLGITFLLGFQLWWMSLLTLVVLGIGTIGVARTVLDKKKIQCACLGTVFNLPMTKVTLIENSIMLVMAVGMMWVL